MTVETMKIPAELGMVSLVGVNTTKMPVSFGNYFSFANGLRCINMWAENLESAATKYLTDGLVRVDVWKEDGRRWAVVTDGRLPEDYLAAIPCFTGYGAPSLKVLEEMGDAYGWINNDDYRKFTDSDNWHREQGWTVSENGIMSKTVGGEARKLKAKWTIERNTDLVFGVDEDTLNSLVETLSEKPDDKNS